MLGSILGPLIFGNSHLVLLDANPRILTMAREWKAATKFSAANSVLQGTSTKVTVSRSYASDAGQPHDCYRYDGR